MYLALMDQPAHILPVNTTVRTHHVLESTRGMGPAILSVGPCREPNKIGQILHPAPGAGGDLYYVKHSFGIGVYCWSEFELVGEIPGTEVYISTDIETDGPLPGPNSMLSFGSAAFTGEGLRSTFSVNLELLEGATPDPATKSEFWDKHPEAWAACRLNPEPVEAAMKRYVAWVKTLPGKPVFVGYPAGFDFLFMYWYLIRFAGESPFSFSALDIKTYAMATMRLPFRESTKKRMPKQWFSSAPHTHIALDDAIEQGHLFMSMLRHNLGQ